MLRHARTLAGGLALGAALALTAMASPPAVEAQQAGSVKVTITHGPCIVCDLRTNPEVAAALAANVCGRPVRVGEIKLAIEQQGQFTCGAETPIRFVEITPA